MLNALVVDREQGTVDSPLHPNQVELLDGVAIAVKKLNDLGFDLKIVSNQPAVAKGKTTPENLTWTHRRVLELVMAEGGIIESSHICFHRAEDDCACRKPKTQLLQDALAGLSPSLLAQSWMVGDGLTDIEAGQRMSLNTAYLGPERCDHQKALEQRNLKPTQFFKSLRNFADWLSVRTPGVSAMTFTQTFLDETATLVRALPGAAIENMALGLARTRDRGGRLFILGVGGSAGHASHAVNDFRKICGFEAYAPTDNVSELTARVNDEGWDTVFVEWLKTSRLNSKDALLIFSVGGGDRERNISVGLVRALELAVERGASSYGVVGKEGGFTRRVANETVVIPPLFADRITPHTEGLAAVVWHLLVSHPALKIKATKWESTHAAHPEHLV